MFKPGDHVYHVYDGLEGYVQNVEGDTTTILMGNGYYNSDRTEHYRLKVMEEAPTTLLAQRKQEGRCPVCGELGPFCPRTLIPVCSIHGPY